MVVVEIGAGRDAVHGLIVAPGDEPLARESSVVGAGGGEVGAHGSALGVNGIAGGPVDSGRVDGAGIFGADESSAGQDKQGNQRSKPASDPLKSLVINYINYY